MGWGSLGLPHGDKVSWNGEVCPAHVSSVRTYKEIRRNMAGKIPKVWLVGVGAWWVPSHMVISIPGRGHSHCVPRHVQRREINTAKGRNNVHARQRGSWKHHVVFLSQKTTLPSWTVERPCIQHAERMKNAKEVCIDLNSCAQS